MGAQIPVIEEKPLAVCGCRKFQVDALGDHICTCTTHSGVKKDHDEIVFLRLQILVKVQVYVLLLT
jgi:hypothetical protein